MTVLTHVNAMMAFVDAINASINVGRIAVDALDAAQANRTGQLLRRTGGAWCDWYCFFSASGARGMDRSSITSVRQPPALRKSLTSDMVRGNRSS